MVEKKKLDFGVTKRQGGYRGVEKTFFPVTQWKQYEQLLFQKDSICLKLLSVVF